MHEHLESAGGRSAGLTGGTESSKLVLDEVLWSRIRRLPEEARRVLELIAISGRPLRLVELSQCADLAQDERVALALLRAGRLIRSTGRAETDEVETYHDRVREAVVARLEPDAARRIITGWLWCWRPRARPIRRCWACTSWVRTCRNGQPSSSSRRPMKRPRCWPSSAPRRCTAARWSTSRARAARSGSSARAWVTPWPTPAEGPTQPAPTSRPWRTRRLPKRSSCTRRAAMQFLISGHIDEGLAILQTVLATVGMTLPSTPLRSLASLLWRRTRLRLRGLGFRERDPSEIAAADLTRIDVCWSAGRV